MPKVQLYVMARTMAGINELHSTYAFVKLLYSGGLDSFFGMELDAPNILGMN